VGVFRRLTDITRATLTDSRKGRRADRPLSELTDEELEEELLRRRRERAKGRARGRQHRDREQSPQEKQLAQYYANLELEPGASLDDIRTAYRELMRKYHPDKHLGDPERHKAATLLAQNLTTAYKALVDHLEKRR